MNSSLINILCSLIILLSANAFASDSPEDMRPWELGIVFPSLYPVDVERSYGTNIDYNWTSLMETVFTAHKGKLTDVRRFYSEYDGYALPLIITATSTLRQIRYTNTLPDTVYIHWASLVEHKKYVTQFELTDKIKTEMKSGGKWRGRQPGGSHCYKNVIVFGLLPGGQAKIWLSGCRTYMYVGSVSAISETQIYGSNKIYRELVGQDAKQFAIDNNMPLFPIPKLKVDKILTGGRYEVLK